ncbi:MAG: amino acid deaminase [Variovorax paradoxus]|nr:MAG: amino acid deaminase [Variovorax paradoxus]PZQ00169.1 MAG: amino acid deaminase [Variovorax paradoxus]
MSTVPTAQIDADLPLTGNDKGMPCGIAPLRIDQVAAQGWNVLKEDLPLPLAVLKQQALAHNSAWMRDFLADSGAQISPHGKTSMSPQLFALQEQDGAWAITISTAHQLHVVRSAGFKRIVMANQLLGRKSIDYVLDELKRDPDFEFYCLVDSVEGVELLAEAARAREVGRPLQVLLEGGFQSGRTGCRSLEQAMSTARAVHAASPYLCLSGVEGFEGMIRRPTTEETLSAVQDFLRYLVSIANECTRESLFGADLLIMSAGGSIYYDMVATEFAALDLGRPYITLTRSGCYLTHDSVVYVRAQEGFNERNPAVAQRSPGLQPAIEVWAYVQSRPEPELAIVTMGKRDVTPDHPPKLLQWYRPDGSMATPVPAPKDHTIIDLNDQHARLSVPADSPLRVGDMLCFGIGHPCLTFDKWRVMLMTDDRYDVVGAVRTYF